MSQRLQGKVALVTGAARGIGRAAAVLFAAEGASVLGADLTDATYEEGAGSVVPGELPRVDLDVSDAAQWAATMAEVKSVFGGLDILVNNAGTSSPPVGLEAMAMEDWHRVLEVNITGTMLGMRNAIPLLRARGGGTIVNVSSMFARVAANSSPAYQASKAAVRVLSKAAALELGGENIRVNTVEPGLTDTAILGAQGAERIDDRLRRTPLNRIAAPEEVAQGILFLASTASSYVTGTDLVVDGGYTAC